jgi:hypothetical protein
LGRPAAVIVCFAALVVGCGDGAGTSPGFSIVTPRGWRSLKATSPVRLAAADPLRRARMSIVETRVPEMLSFRQFAHNEAKEIALASRPRNLQLHETRLLGGRALRVTYSLPSSAVHQYFVRRGEFLYVLTLRTVPATTARYAKIFDQSVRTFRLR